MLNDYTELCNKYGVKIENPTVLERIQYWRIEVGICKHAGGNVSHTSIVLMNFTDRERELIAFLHEVGHTQSDMAESHELLLTRELAANTWVLQNYEEYRIDKGVLIEALKEWILTYINDSHNKSIHTEELENTARELGVYELVQWVE